MTVGERINNLRKKKGLSQKELAVLIGVTQVAVWKIENGKTTASIDRLSAIACALETSFDYLAFGEQEAA